MLRQASTTTRQSLKSKAYVLTGFSLLCLLQVLVVVLPAVVPVVREDIDCFQSTLSNGVRTHDFFPGIHGGIYFLQFQDTTLINIVKEHYHNLRQNYSAVSTSCEQYTQM